LNLASGQELDLTIGINQAGDISQLELSSDSELSEADQNKLRDFFKQLSA
jgi:hypothetical protein